MENLDNQNAAAADLPIPQRLGRIEAMFEKIMGYIDTAAPFASAIPGAAPIVAAVEGVGHAIETVIDITNGDTGTVDAAALAADSLSKSTGNEALDARLLMIEHAIASLWPVLQAVAKDMGYELPTVKAQ